MGVSSSRKLLYQSLGERAKAEEAHLFLLTLALLQNHHSLLQIKEKGEKMSFGGFQLTALDLFLNPAYSFMVLIVRSKNLFWCVLQYLPSWVPKLDISKQFKK